MMQWSDAGYRLALHHPLLAALRFKPQLVIIADRYQSSAKAGIIRYYYANFLD
jgi:hypothetical protein